jgi:hypothetical protein
MFTFTEQNEIWEVTNDDLFCDLPSLMDLHLGKPLFFLKHLVPNYLSQNLSYCLIFVSLLRQSNLFVA